MIRELWHWPWTIISLGSTPRAFRIQTLIYKFLKLGNTFLLGNTLIRYYKRTNLEKFFFVQKWHKIIKFKWYKHENVKKWKETIKMAFNRRVLCPWWNSNQLVLNFLFVKENIDWFILLDHLNTNLFLSFLILSIGDNECLF